MNTTVNISCIRKITIAILEEEVTLRVKVSQSVCLGISTLLGLATRYYFQVEVEVTLRLTVSQ
jgi:hypothetical protein